MLLAININNTETKVGLFRGDSLESHWRLTTTPQPTPDEWASTLTSYLAQAGRSTQAGRAAPLAPPPPPGTQTPRAALQRAPSRAPPALGCRTARPITPAGEDPRRAGAAR